MKKLFSKKNTVIIMIILIMTIGAAVWYFFIRKKTVKFQEPESNVDIKTGKSINWVGDSFPLKKGSSGEKVKYIQAGMNLMKGENLSIDGKFGNKTEAALQKNFGVNQISESVYFSFVNPNINKIKDYISDLASGRTVSKPASQPETPKSSGNLITNLLNKDFSGKSIVAARSFSGFIAKSDDDLEYIIDEKQPVQYSSGQYIGIAEKEDNGWIRAIRTNGSRIFVLKSNVRLS